jgi:hypothetical protein
VLVSTAAMLCRQVATGCVDPHDVVRTFEYQGLQHAADQTPVVAPRDDIDTFVEAASAHFHHDLPAIRAGLWGPGGTLLVTQAEPVEEAPEHDDDGKR